MKRLTTTVVAALTLTSLNAFAAPGDVQGGGNIQFTGSVETDTCFVESATGDAKTINVPMGTFNTLELTNATLASPALSRGPNSEGPSFIITCSTDGAVAMKFAAPTSMLEAGNKVLKINGGITGDKLASGIGIAVFPDSANLGDKAFDLSNGTLYNGTLTGGEKKQVSFAVGYVKTTGAITGGTANATLPFTIVTP